MICILSSAKTFSPEPLELDIATEPLLVDKSERILKHLQEQRPDDLQKLFHVSEKIADLNYGRYQNWDTQTESPVLHFYNGDAYRALKEHPLTTTNWKHANTHIAILSGLYGILRPTDNIRPHRLEMGTQTKELIGKNLYEFWTEDVSEKLNQIVHKAKAKYILNVASKEYYSALNKERLSVPVIDVDFKTQTSTGLKTIAIYAKKARGAMARYVLDNQITEPEDLKEFCFNGYKYSKDLSEKNKFVFTSIKI